MELRTIESKIYNIRSCKVMLDHDLTELYQTETKVLKQSVRRNIDRFPGDFMFELKKDEYDSLRSQNVTLKNRGQHSKYLPFAFTEQGVAMLSSVLRSRKAITVNIAIMRTFLFMRQFALSHEELTLQLEELEKRFNKQFSDVYEALPYLNSDKDRREEWSKRKKIGF